MILSMDQSEQMRGLQWIDAYLAHLHIDGADAATSGTIGILAFTSLGAAAQEILSAINNPAVPRNVQIDGNVSGIDGVVTVHGTNYADAEIEEEITANGTSTVAGAKAFKSITKIDLPIQDHSRVAQVETATAAGTVTTAGNALVTVTSALFESDETIDVLVELDDDANAIALAVRTALAANEVVSAHFTVSGSDAAIILTAKVAAANDATLNIAIDDGAGEGASEGVTTAATSANTTAGVDYDKISVGWGDKFGLPFILTHDTLVKAYLDNSADSASVTINADELEKNVIDMSGSPDGAKDIDAYFII
jgi:hypothetical protein